MFEAAVPLPGAAPCCEGKYTGLKAYNMVLV